MPSVFVEERTFQQTDLRQQPRNQRHFKNDSHHKDQHQEIIHIRIQRDLFRYIDTQLISCQKAQRHREYHKISDSTSDKEHDCSQKKYPFDIFLLILIQSRTNELPDFPHQIRESKHKCQPERGGHVSKELRCQSDIKHIHMKIIITEIRQNIKPRTDIDQPLVQIAQPSVKDKIGITGCQYYAVKYTIATTHKGETAYRKDKER